MPALVYLHGFLSSPLSTKALQTQEWLAAHRPDISYHCPFLSSYPGKARKALEQLMSDLTDDAIGLVGSSLGGFWATYLAEKHNVPAVLVNPAVSPHTRFAEVVGQRLKNYHTDDEYCLTDADLRELIDADIPQLNNAQKYWLMVQTGDETLDYRLALERYGNARVLKEKGGSHSFDGYERWIPELVEFLFDGRCRDLSHN